MFNGEDIFKNVKINSAMELGAWNWAYYTSVQEVTADV
jgi:hypothetical protein